MLRRNPLTTDAQTTLRAARLQLTPGPDLARPTGGSTDGGAAGSTDGGGNFQRFGALDIDLFDDFRLS